MANIFDFSLCPGPVIFTATNDDDCIIGSRFSDTFYALAGNDLVTAGAGDDWVDGGAGNDALAAGPMSAA